MENLPGYSFIADDFPLFFVSESGLVGTFDPEKQNSNTKISYLTSPNRRGEKAVFQVPIRQRNNAIVQIKKVVWLQLGDTSEAQVRKLEVGALMSIVNNSIRSLNGGMTIGDEVFQNIEASMVTIPREIGRRFADLHFFRID